MSEVVAYKDSNNNYWDTEVENSTPIKHKSEDALNIMRHDMAHILAEAVISLFPNAKPTIGPFIKNGFYYDFDVEKPFTPENLKDITKLMQKIINKNSLFIGREVSKSEAFELVNGNQY